MRKFRCQFVGFRVAVLAVCLVSGLTWTSEAASRRPVKAENGMVVSAHPAASREGLEMLKKGGNAVDAAVATAFVVGVVEPYSSGIGGGGFMLIHLSQTSEVIVIDYRETAPAAAHRDMYLDADGNVIEDKSLEGHLAVATPGTVAGLTSALEQFGSLSLKDVLEPAIRMAAEGFEADEVFVNQSRNARDVLASFPETKKIFLKEGDTPFSIGDMVIQSDLAQTLRSIAENGSTAFYGGEIAKSIASEMAENGGLLTEKDLAGYQPRLRKPLRGSYRGYDIVSMPPPSSGGVFLIQMLNVLEGYDLQKFGFGSSRTVHAMVETMRRAYADRAEFLGDPSFTAIPLRGLLSKEYGGALRASIDFGRAGDSAQIGHGNPAGFQESDQTTHISVVDKNLNAVTMTQTINGPFGSGVVVPGTGILLNNEMDDFSAKPGTPNLFGLVGKEANAIAPGKIPLSSMSPTLVFKDGKLFMVVGTPGGGRIITTVLQILVNVIDHGMNVREAIDMPRFHHQWLPDEIQLERFAAPKDVYEALKTRGHTVVEIDVFGNAMGILIDPESGQLQGAADFRRVGEAIGY